MFLVLLKFSDNKHLAAQYMDAHNQWIKEGFDKKIFLVVGSLQPGLGGAIWVTHGSKEELISIVNKDPFVQHSIVKPEILEYEPKKWDDRLQEIFAA